MRHRTTRAHCAQALRRLCRQMGKPYWGDLHGIKRNTMGHGALALEKVKGHGYRIIQMTLGADGVSGGRPAFGVDFRTPTDVIRTITDAEYALSLINWNPSR